GQDVASHLWRVPGTLNWPTKSKLKRGRSPIAQSVRLKEQFRGVLVKSDDLNLSAPESKTVAFEKVQPPRTVRQEKPQNKSLSFEEQFKLQNDLEQWRPASECSYDEWLRVGMACHNANCRFIWDIWSRGSIKFDAAKQEKSWKSFSEEGSSGDPVTMGSIYSWIALVKKAEFHKKHKGCGDFIDEYEPISYTLENMLPSGKLYFLTARRSTGKTAFLMTAMFAIAFNRPDIIGTGVTPGHTAYIAFENPTDIRMKIAVYAHHFGISKQELNEKITIIDARMSTEDVFDQLTDAAEEKGKFQLVLYDHCRPVKRRRRS